MCKRLYIVVLAVLLVLCFALSAYGQQDGLTLTPQQQQEALQLITDLKISLLQRQAEYQSLKNNLQKKDMVLAQQDQQLLVAEKQINKLENLITNRQIAYNELLNQNQMISNDLTDLMKFYEKEIRKVKRQRNLAVVVAGIIALL